MFVHISETFVTGSSYRFDKVPNDEVSAAL